MTIEPRTQAREPMFNAPLLPLLVAASMPVLFFFQLQAWDGAMRWAFRPAELMRGEWMGLLTSMLLHGGWTHALMNAVAALTFGAPVARLMPSGKGALGFLALYIVCGVLAALGYGLLHMESEAPLMGASGAVFGLIGAATRLMGGRGRLAPLTDRRVVTASAAWMGLNVVTGLIGFAPGLDGARIAWEAHAVGFLAGLLLIGPWLRLFFVPRPAFDSTARMSDPRA